MQSNIQRLEGTDFSRHDFMMSGLLQNEDADDLTPLAGIHYDKIHVPDPELYGKPVDNGALFIAGADSQASISGNPATPIPSEQAKDVVLLFC